MHTLIIYYNNYNINLHYIIAYSARHVHVVILGTVQNRYLVNMQLYVCLYDRVALPKGTNQNLSI